MVDGEAETVGRPIFLVFHRSTVVHPSFLCHSGSVSDRLWTGSPLPAPRIARMNAFRPLLAGVAAAALFSAATPAADTLPPGPPYRVLAQDRGKVAIVGPDGKVEWEI